MCDRVSVDECSKATADEAVDWLRAVLNSKLGDPGAFGKIAVEISINGGKIPGSAKVTDEVHIRGRRFHPD